MPYTFKLLLTALTGLLIPLSHGQTELDIPPPSDLQPDRIMIPIADVRTAIENSNTGENTQEEIAAFAIAAEANGWIPIDSSGRLRNGTMVRVTVMVQGNMEHATESQRINHSGYIGLPLLQNVMVGNMDLEELEDLLTSKYSEYYREPLVNVEFVGDTNDPNQSPWGYVTMMGNVASSGPLAMPPTQSLTISGAVKLAGGLAASANKGSIRIFRPHPEKDEVEVIRVDLEDLARKGKQAEDVNLRAGDVVYIPERIF